MIVLKILNNWYVKAPLFFIICFIIVVKSRGDDLSYYEGMSSIPRQPIGFLLRNHGVSLLNTISYTLNFVCIPMSFSYFQRILSGNARYINNTPQH